MYLMFNGNFKFSINSLVVLEEAGLCTVLVKPIKLGTSRTLSGRGNYEETYEHFIDVACRARS